jgi:hypothetical protein
VDVETPIITWPNASQCDSEVAPLRVKLVQLPGLPEKGDVVDFLERRALVELLHLIESAPYWTPDGAEQQRRDRRREKAAERQRRRRARLRAEREAVQWLSRSECPGMSCHAVTPSRSANVLLSTLHPTRERTSEEPRIEHSQRDELGMAA